MKTKTAIKIMVTGIVAGVLLFTACKKAETGPAGPAGAAGANGVVPMSSDGYIKGNVTGTRKDGTAFNEAFDFKNYWGSPSGKLDSLSSTNYAFSISRGEDIWGANYASVNIKTSTKTASTGTMSMNFMFTKSLGTNKQFEFSTYSSMTAPISGLSYNTSTGLFSGSFTYTVSGLQNSSGNLATISGSFQATITQIYNKISTTSAIIKD